MKASPKTIIRLVAERFGFEPRELKASSRAADLVVARHVAMYLIRALLGLSYPAIGREFRRDHSTAVNAVHGIEKQLAIDTTLAADIAALIDAIGKTDTAAPIVDKCPHCNRAFVSDDTKSDLVESAKANIATLSAQIELLGGAT